MIKSLTALLLGTLSFAALAEDTAADALVQRGEYLARAGDCVACHSTAGGKPFAGGLPMVTPIGTIYSTNITPDKEPALVTTAMTTSRKRCVMAWRKTATRSIRRCRIHLMRWSAMTT